MTETQFWCFLERMWKMRGREAIMIILAHHGSNEALYALRMYNIKSHKGLEIFAEMALDECESWNNGAASSRVDLIRGSF